MSNSELTEKTEATLTAAIQLAKDYANSQVQPVHLASAMLNEGVAPAPPGAMPKSGAQATSLFIQAIQKAGGDQVRTLLGLY
jgi:ATP-dependent Clp protease ATP-binding subunit ClpB